MSTKNKQAPPAEVPNRVPVAEVTRRLLELGVKAEEVIKRVKPMDPGAEELVGFIADTYKLSTK